MEPFRKQQPSAAIRAVAYLERPKANNNTSKLLLDLVNKSVFL